MDQLDAVLYYTVAKILQPTVVGLLFTALLPFMGVHGTGMETWAIDAVIGTAIILYLSRWGIQLSTRLAGNSIALGMLIVIALATTIDVTRVASGNFSVALVTPTLFKAGPTVFSAAIIVYILSCTGWDVIATTGEKGQQSRRVLFIPTLLWMIGVGVFWALSSWMLSVAVPLSEVARLDAPGVTAVTRSAAEYWLVGQILVTLIGMSAATFVYVASSAGASLPVFAMARRGPWRHTSESYTLSASCLGTRCSWDLPCR